MLNHIHSNIVHKCNNNLMCLCAARWKHWMSFYQKLCTLLFFVWRVSVCVCVCVVGFNFTQVVIIFSLCSIYSMQHQKWRKIQFFSEVEGNAYFHTHVHASIYVRVMSIFAMHFIGFRIYQSLYNLCYGPEGKTEEPWK